MKIFLDTADVPTIVKHYGTGLIDGITTNPTLILKSGRQPHDVYRELQGYGIPVSYTHLTLPTTPYV